MSYSLTRGTTIAIAVRFTSIACAFLLEIVIARALSIQQYGVYSIAINWLVLLSLLCSLGLDTTAIKLIPYYRAKQQWRLLKEFLGFIKKTSLLFSSVMLLAVAGFALVYSYGHKLDTVYPLLLAAAILPLSVMAGMQGAVLRGLMQAVKADFPTGIVRPLLIMSVVAALVLLFGTEVTALHVITAYGVSLALVIALYNRIIRREEPALAGEEALEDGASRDWLRQSMPMLVVAGMSMLVSRIDVLMIGAILDEQQAGIYAVASRIADLLTVTLIAVNAVVAPRVSHFHAMQQQAELQSLITRSSRIIFASTLLLLLMIVLFERLVLNLFGHGYLEATGSMHILLVAQAINAFSGSVGYLMLMTGRHWLAAKVLAGAAIVDVGLNLLLLPRMGIEGAAIAKGVAIIAWNVILLWQVRHHLRIDATPIGRVVHD